jgi:hypothetical protein
MKLLMVLFIVLCGNAIAQTPSPSNPTLATQLEQIYELDQKYRTTSDWKMMMKQDSANLVEVVKILDDHGWLGPEEVGGKGNAAIFLVIQHAELPVQEKFLPMMRDAVKQKKARMKDLALLEDRVLMRQNKKQIYGSQVVKVNGSWVAHPIEDPAHVDERRAEIGLEPIAIYLERLGVVWNLEEHLQQQK